jgi:hypothetical protein
MTIGEACDLVVTAAGHAVQDDQRTAFGLRPQHGQLVRIAELPNG